MFGESDTVTLHGDSNKALGIGKGSGQGKPTDLYPQTIVILGDQNQGRKQISQMITLPAMFILAGTKRAGSR
jgi:hypothetical protein